MSDVAAAHGGPLRPQGHILKPAALCVPASSPATGPSALLAQWGGGEGKHGGEAKGMAEVMPPLGTECSGS